MKRVVLFLLAVTFVLGGPAAARGDRPTPSNVGELLRSYGIESAPADYVVVVDTSSSMMDPPALYPPVVRAYKNFVSAIRPQDQLSVVTFDETPDLRFSDDLGTATKRKDARDALPARAVGGGTDIGSAIDAVLERLERPGSNEVQTVIFLTDGQIYAPGSPYAKQGSAAWRALHHRATQVAAGHRLSVYGAGLGGEATDVASLKLVFPDTQVVSLPSDQLTSFFKEAVQRARVQRLYTPVTRELREGFVTAEVRPGNIAAETTLTVRLRSHLPHLGARVVLESVKVTDTAGRILRSRLVGGPRTFTIGPGGTSAPVQVKVEQALAAGPRFGSQTQRAQFVVSVNASVTAEPSEVIAKALGIGSTVRLVQADPVTAERSVGTPYWKLVLWIALAVAVLLALLWCYRRFVAVPRLPGGVMLESGAFEPFRGKTSKMPNKDTSFPSSDGAAVEFFTKRGKFRGRTPRVYVRKIEGSCRVEKFGVPSPLQTEVQVLPTDYVIVGRARLRLTPKGR